MYDYLLVVGPGRSGSDFLYHILREHPDFSIPEIKEGMYYRSPGAFRQAWGLLRGKERKLLCDIANTAYHDPALAPGVERLKEEGWRILVVVLMRNHRDRALSMMRFRRSRGEPSALLGTRRLEDAVVRDRLSPQMLQDIFRMNVDVLVVEFPALTRGTAGVLDALASLCATPKFQRIPRGSVNESVRPRLIWFSALGHSCAVALRRLGFLRLLQRIKDSALVRSAFFVPLPKGGDGLRLSAESLKTLDAAHLACRSLVERSSERLREGVYFRRADPARQKPRGLSTS